MEEQGSAMPGSGLRLTFKVCYIREAASRGWSQQTGLQDSKDKVRLDSRQPDKE